MRPSTVGPLDENEARTPNESTAAMASTLSPCASAGAPTLRPTAGLLPSLPAETTTRMPFAAAISAARVTMLVWPSSIS